MGNGPSLAGGAEGGEGDPVMEEQQDTPLAGALKSEDFTLVDNLLKQGGALPTQTELQLALLYCGRNSDILLNMCRMVGQHIRRTCSLIKHIWPAYPYQKNEVVFVALTETTDKISIGLPYTILFRKLDDYSLEGAKITYSRDSLDKPFTAEEQIHLTATLRDHSKALMDKHSNVQMISACSVRSHSFGKFGARIVPETCVVIYVDVKGLIPLAEDPLPNVLDLFPVDVREGGPRLLHSGKGPGEFHDHLLMGCQIASDTNMMGTLGAFLECPITQELCGLTCAHVLLQKDESVIGQEKVALFEENDRKIYQPCPSVLNQIGHVKKAVFKPGGNGKTGVDAALIALTESTRLPRTGEFPKSNDEHAGFTMAKPMMYTSGETYRRDNVPDQFESRSELIKFGCVTGPTRGSFHLNGTSIRRREIEGTFMNFGFQLHNQLEVLSIGPSPTDAFALQGDSGSLVFIPHQGNCSDLRAVGILEGGTFNNTYLVTPIWDVLEALEISHRMKTFPNPEDQALALTTTFANMTIQGSLERSISHQSSTDRSSVGDSLDSLAREIREEDQKTHKRTAELADKVTAVNVHLENQVSDLHGRITKTKEEIYRKINETEENNQKRHAEVMTLLGSLLQSQQK